VNSYLSDDFLDCFARLPVEVRRQARTAYRLWKTSPWHPSLAFKRVSSDEPVYAVRVGLGWRALGLMEDGDVTWIWIGSHSDYDRLLDRL
jgi:hypothetical protein